MNELVKIKEPDELYVEHWHLVSKMHGDNQVLCNGMFFGSGASDSEYETKQVKRGGITCSECLRLIKEYKKVKL